MSTIKNEVVGFKIQTYKELAKDIKINNGNKNFLNSILNGKFASRLILLGIALKFSILSPSVKIAIRNSRLF